MTGHHKFSQLTADFSDSRKAKIAAQTQQLKAEIAKAELDEIWETYQTQIADRLNLPLSQVAQLEQDTKLYLTSLRQAIQSAGGELNITVRFGDREIKIQEYN